MVYTYIVKKKGKNMISIWGAGGWGGISQIFDDAPTKLPIAKK